MIVVDTSALVDSLTGPRRSAAVMRALLAEGERLVLPALVLYEWWRGPRLEPEIDARALALRLLDELGASRPRSSVR